MPRSAEEATSPMGRMAAELCEALPGLAAEAATDHQLGAKAAGDLLR